MYPLYAIQRALPIEIIDLILHNHGDFDHSRQKFRRVCKAWNKLVLTTSDMWTDVVIDEHSALAGTLDTLERSHDRQLNLSVILPDNDDIDISHFAFIPYILNAQASRIASLHVEGASHKHFVSALWSQTQLPMPLLHTVTLINDDHLIPTNTDARIFDPTQENLPHPYPTLLQCPPSTYNGTVDKVRRNALIDAWGSRMYPALNDVAVIGVPLDWDRFPITNLTELRLVNQHVRLEGPRNDNASYHIADIIRFLSPTLEVLEFTDFVYDIASDSVTWDPVELSELRSLTLGYSGDPVISTSVVTTFLGILCAPRLREVTITNRRVLSGFKARLPPSKIQALIEEAKEHDEDLLMQLMQWHTIHDLEQLTLDCVVFHGDSRSLRPSTILRTDIEQPWTESKIDAPDLKILEKDTSTGVEVAREPPFALGFVRMLESVRHLDIRDPTGHFLYFMNYPIAHQSASPYVLFNLSTLETLRIYTPNWILASAFLGYRKRIQPALDVDVYPALKRRIVTCECHSTSEFAPMARSSVEGEVRDMVDGWYEVANGWPEERLKDTAVCWRDLLIEHRGYPTPNDDESIRRDLLQKSAGEGSEGDDWGESSSDEED